MTTETVAALLERERDLEVLARALADAEQGHGQFVLVEAPAGLGKTSLLTSAAQTAATAGYRCFRARAGELERDFAYGCVRQLLEPVVARASPDERERLFHGAASLAAPLFSDAGVPEPQSDSVFSVLHGLYWLVNNLVADGPALVTVDDLHWCDAASLRFLNYLAPRLDGLALTVVATTRPGENPTTELARLLTLPETQIRSPAPLSAEATAALCERRLAAGVPAEFAAACHDATGGNPFFLEALLREVKEQEGRTGERDAALVHRFGPSVVAQSVLLRLSGEPESAADLLRAGAVLGDGASIAEAARLAGLAAKDAASAADRLVALSIFEAADSIRFAHPIVREAVYADIGANERALAHARAAEVLAECGATDERIAAQVAKAPPQHDADRVILLRRVAAGA